MLHNVSIKDILVSALLTEIQAGNNKFSSYARTSLTVESLSQARARATKPEPPSQSCRARAAEPEPEPTDSYF